MMCPICKTKQKHLDWWLCKECMKSYSSQELLDILLIIDKNSYIQEALF